MAQPTRGAIAAGHPQTAAAGLEMLRLGGNAFDGAIAAMMAAFVTEPALTSPAGGGFLLAHTSRDENILFDFFTQTPQAKRTDRPIDFYPIDVNFGTAVQQFHIGLGSIATPGTLAGVFHVHQRLGRLPLSVVAEPALHYARTGAEVNEFQAYCLDILRPILLRSDAFRAVIAPTGTLVTAGDRLLMPDLANTLEYLVQEGLDPFYHGEIGLRLVQDCQERGGYLSQKDLRDYRVVERSPLTTHYRGHTLLTNPPPSSGGTLIAFALHLLASLDLGKLEFGSPKHLRILAEVMRLTNQARASYVARLQKSGEVETFLSLEDCQPYRDALALTAAGAVNKWGSTTHISVIDGEGNAASVTASNGEGSSYVIPGTGIMTNNMLGEADLHPNGFHAWQENVRISSMMAPTLILNRDHRPEIVLGSGGSNRIRTAILQVITNLLDFQMPIHQAVNSPRLHWESDVLSLEPGFFVATTDPSTFPFDGRVDRWDSLNMFFGGVHAVTQTADGFDGAGDSRRGGAVAVN
ncbi:MAG: gamma-glutamyltransferase [Synechococcales bacterium]|nr:gamma-glutamyltransferase [Synechococcales bacterium]